jgi:hypothetical protein
VSGGNQLRMLSIYSIDAGDAKNGGGGLSIARTWTF